VGVDIDKPRGHDLAPRVDLLCACPDNLADSDDPSVADTDISLKGWRPCAVNNGPAPHHEVEYPIHGVSPGPLVSSA
jgi:hypothetical protein